MRGVLSCAWQEHRWCQSQPSATALSYDETMFPPELMLLSAISSHCSCHTKRTVKESQMQAGHLSE